MKLNRFLKSFAALAVVALALGTSAVRADSSYAVTINTAPLVGNLTGPFSLDFQSIFGSGLAQTINVSQLSYNGGSSLDSGTFIGAVSGSSATVLTFNTDSVNNYNEFFQSFSNTVSSISFNVDLSSNASGAQPTGFSVSLLDSSLMNLVTDGVGNSLALFSISGEGSSYALGSTLGEGTGGVTISLTQIPEPSTYALVVGAAALGAGMLRRRNRLAA